MMNGKDNPDAETEADRQLARQTMDRLNDNNRILREARMLPENRALTVDEIADVVSQFNTYCDENSIPQRHAARQCGYTVVGFDPR